MTQALFTALVLAVALERVAELVVSKRNAAWAFARGGVEHGRGHYPVMVVLHTGLLAGAVAEVWLLDRPFVPALGWTMFALVIASQGRQWNTRVIVVPGLQLVTRGPYRRRRHPNYVAVVVEGLALPLVHTAWATAAAFTVLNLLLLSVRIRVEEQALGLRAGAA